MVISEVPGGSPEKVSMSEESLGQTLWTAKFTLDQVQYVYERPPCGVLQVRLSALYDDTFFDPLRRG